MPTNQLGQTHKLENVRRDGCFLDINTPCGGVTGCRNAAAAAAAAQEVGQAWTSESPETA